MRVLSPSARSNGNARASGTKGRGKAFDSAAPDPLVFVGGPAHVRHEHLTPYAISVPDIA
eukprot:499732-Rhodomonas_salina.1